MASTFGNSTSGIAVVRELLEEVYEGFKEGFDMPLLREAKALLQELA
jgi:transcriptional regulatory protein LevR